MCMYTCHVLYTHINSYKPLESRKIEQGSPAQKIHKQGRNWWRFHYSQVAKLLASLVDKKKHLKVKSREKLCTYFFGIHRDTPTQCNFEPENNDLLKAAPIEFLGILMMRRMRIMSNTWGVNQKQPSSKPPSEKLPNPWQSRLFDVSKFYIQVACLFQIITAATVFGFR